MNRIKNQIDKWTVFHLFGPMILAYILKSMGFELVYSIVYTIFLSLSWEIMDTLAYYYPISGTFNNLFDRKGASWVDFAVCGIGISLYILVLYVNGYAIERFEIIISAYIIGLFVAYWLYTIGGYNKER